MATFNGSKDNYNAGSGTTLACSAGLSVAVGDEIHVLFHWEGATGATVSISDGLGNTFTEITSQTFGGGEPYMKTYKCRVTNAGTSTPSALLSAARTERNIVAHFFSPDSGFAFADDSPGSATASGTSNAPASGSLSVGGKAIVSGLMALYNNARGTPGTGWTEAYDANIGYSEYRLPTSSGSFNANMSWGATDSWLAAIISSLENATGGGGNSISVPAGSLTLSGKVPTVTATANNAIAVPLATMTLTGNAPTVTATAGQYISVPAGSLTISGQTPTVTATQNNNLAIPAGSLTLTGFAPTVQSGANQSISVPSGSITLIGFAPTISQTANQQIAVPAGALTLNGFAPSIAQSDNQFVQVPAGSLTLTGIAPAVQAGGPQVIDVPLGVLTITVYAPDVLAPAQNQNSGGYGFWPDYEQIQRARRKRRRELEEAEEQARLIQDELDREIFRQQRALEAAEAERADLERLQRLADRYATSAPSDLPKHARIAILNAQDARTRNALEQMARVIEQTLEDELVAIQHVVLLMLTD